jgi:hypothetical protein
MRVGVSLARAISVNGRRGEMQNPGEVKADERRIAPRRRVLKAAQVVYNNGGSVLECVVEDLSLTGARVSLASPAVLPEGIGIRFQDGTWRPARIVWKMADQMGVHFLDAPVSERKAAQSQVARGTKAMLLARIEDIELQLTELRVEIVKNLQD